MQRGLWTATSVAVIAVALALLVPLSAAASPPKGLTKYGRWVWNLEALMDDRFGNRLVCMSHDQDFAPRYCNTGIANIQAYSPTFANARRSAFKLALSAPSNFGNIGGLYRLSGRYIKCGENRWLTRLRGGIGLSLGCEKPLGEG